MGSGGFDDRGEGCGAGGRFGAVGAQCVACREVADCVEGRAPTVGFYGGKFQRLGNELSDSCAVETVQQFGEGSLQRGCSCVGALVGAGEAEGVGLGSPQENHHLNSW